MGLERDGEAGIELTDRTGRESPISCPDEAIERISAGSGIMSGACSKKSVWNIVENQVGNKVEDRFATQMVDETVRNTIGRSVENVVRIWRGDAVRNSWQHGGERWLETSTTNGKQVKSYTKCYLLNA